MKIKIGWILVICLLVTSILSSCSSSTTTNTTSVTNTATSPPINSTSANTTTSNSIPTTSSTTLISSTVTDTTTGNWWATLGTPQYGGTITLTLPSNITSWDPYQGEGFNQIYTGYMEQLYSPDWTEDPSAQNYQIGFWDNSFAAGGLIQNWEFTNPSTLVLTLRSGINWQNIAPSNGRALTAADVAYHFDREYGLGDGFTVMSPYWVSASAWSYLKSVTATGNSTVTMNWGISNPEYVLENMEAPGCATTIEDPDAVSAYTTSGNAALANWHNAIGTGPFILTDFVDDTSATLIKNSSYWGHDERYPQNQLPYVNQLSFLVIPNIPTALAALRTGKIDVVDNVTNQEVQGMQQTNPSISVVSVPGASAANTIDPRNDLAPFNTLNVRIALQEALDLPTIAKTYYNNVVSPYPSTLTSQYLTGIGWPYPDWPASLQAEYAYNPTNAKALLAAAGYPNGFNTNIVVPNTVDAGLLEIIQSYFNAIGVNMSITPMDPVAWSSYVQVSHSNKALAMSGNGELALNYAPFIQFLRFQPGNAANYINVNDPAFTAALANAMSATTTAQFQQVLQAANQEVAQQHFVISLLIPPTYSLAQPWLKGFNAQYGATWGYVGPQLIYFYDARFWIDQQH